MSQAAEAKSFDQKASGTREENSLISTQAFSKLAAARTMTFSSPALRMRDVATHSSMTHMNGATRFSTTRRVDEKRPLSVIGHKRPTSRLPTPAVK